MNMTRIGPEGHRISGYIQRLWQYRKLIWTLAIRDIKIRYAQTVLGLIWAALQPLTGVAIFTFFFSYLIQIDTGEIPYPLIAITGLTIWNYFSFIINNGGTALITSQELIKKLNFPKMAIVLSKGIVGLADLGVTIVILLLMILFTAQGISLKIFILPLAICLTAIAGLSLAMWLAASTVRYRDLQHLVPYIVNLGMWLTPVFYPSTLLPDQLKFILYLNPIAAIIQWSRYSLLDVAVPEWQYFYSMLVLAIVFVTGFLYFKNAEKRIPDYI